MATADAGRAVDAVLAVIEREYMQVLVERDDDEPEIIGGGPYGF